MARAREPTRRGSGPGDEPTTTGEPIAPAATNATGGDAPDQRSVGRRVMNWLGYGLDEPGSNEGSTENPTTEFVPTAEVAEVTEVTEVAETVEATEATEAADAIPVAEVADEAMDTDLESPAWYPAESRNGGSTEGRI